MAIASWRRPSAAVALVVCMYGIEQFLQAKDAYFVSNGSYVNIASALVVIIAFARQWQQKNLSLSPSPTFWLVLTLLLYEYVSFVWGVSTPMARDEWKDAVPYLVMFVGVTPFLLDDPKSLRYALGLTLVLGAFTACALFFGTNWSVRGIDLASTYGPRRANMPGSTGAPLAIAELGGTLAIIASLASYDKVRFWKLIRWGLVILGLALVFRTQSRGQVLATFIVILMFQPVSGRPVGMKSIFIGIFLTFFLALIFYVLLPIMDENRWFMASRSMSGRMRSATILMRDFSGDPSAWIFGKGAGASWRLLRSYPHNVTVEVLYESGLIGLTLFGGFCVTIFRRIFDFTKDPLIDKETRPVLATAFALFSFFLMISFKQGSVYSSISLLMFGIICDRLTLDSRNKMRGLDSDEDQEIDQGLAFR